MHGDLNFAVGQRAEGRNKLVQAEVKQSLGSTSKTSDSPERAKQGALRSLIGDTANRLQQVIEGRSLYGGSWQLRQGAPYIR